MIIQFNVFQSKFLWRQILLSTIGFMEGFNCGGIFAFSSILFEQLKQVQEIQLDTDDESWLASTPAMTIIPTSLLSGYVMEKLGRKYVILGAEMLFLVGWLMTYFAHSYMMLLGARIIFGFSLGFTYPTIVAFLGEVSVPRYRTLFLSIISIGSTIGAFLCQFLGEYLRWNMVAGIFAISPFCDLFIILHIRESYVTYLDSNLIEQARVNFEWFRGNGPEVKQEFEEIVEAKKSSSKGSFLQLLHMCATKAFLIPFGITTLVFLTNEVTATQAVIFYTSQIIGMITDDADFAYYSILILNILRIVAAISSLILVKISSLRFILISSGFMLAGSLLSLSLFMYLSSIYRENAVFPIICLFALIVNTVLYGIGLGPLPTVVCGEMFPQATRSVGGAGSAALSFAFLFIVLRCMPFLFTGIGAYWTFFIFGIGTLIGITACHFVLPNTKNKTLLEINNLFNKELIVS